MTMHRGLVDQGSKFKKRVASLDTSEYKVVERGQLVVGFPIDEGVLDFQSTYSEAMVSPAYGIWDVRDEQQIDRDYLARYLRSPAALSYYKAKLRGTTARRRSLPAEIFLDLPVPVPVIDDQRRIAEVLGQADAVRAQRLRSLSLLNELAQSAFDEMFGPSQAHPPWDRLTVDEVGQVQGGLQVTATRAELPTKTPYLRVANVHRAALDLRDIKLLGVTASEFTRTRLQAGDLLVVEGHGNAAEIGRVAVWDGSVHECVHQNHLIRVRLDESKILPEYAEAYLNSPEGRKHLLRAANTTSGLNTISTRVVKAAPIALPPMTLQRIFVQQLTRIRALRETLGQHAQELDRLGNSLQHRAFRGDL